MHHPAAAASFFGVPASRGFEGLPAYLPAFLDGQQSWQRQMTALGAVIQRQMIALGAVIWRQMTALGAVIQRQLAALGLRKILNLSQRLSMVEYEG